MTPSLDFDVSNLLCDEDKDCISYDVGDDFKGLDGDIDQSHNESMIPETEHSVLDLHLQNDEYLTLLTVKESEQFVGFVDYFNKLNNQNLFLVARQEAVNWFSKVHAQFNFGPLCAYLSVNYLDRFLAIYELPAGGSRFVFEPKTIQRTELIVLSRLKWRMQSVTPFSFIDSFIRKLNDFGQSQTNSRSLISKSSQLMLCLINGK
ncbi:hypothetical protein L1987_64131 [Smallanthus sonchifolius]|uniref:Uncharacterized protein n=1 Tax=Smallanthus sonchifolius TaxID=185202 RepID=A0ACB9CF76_9ASTR|nr:hypothetical protein L1987_64131 [Smallanthus sonchifolius]